MKKQIVAIIIPPELALVLVACKNERMERKNNEGGDNENQPHQNSEKL